MSACQATLSETPKFDEMAKQVAEQRAALRAVQADERAHRAAIVNRVNQLQ
jgi:hypothetical protein